MSGKRNLSQVLARQWIAFALVLAAGFSAMTLLLLFVLEDGFIDDRLGNVAGGIVDLESARLPDRFELHAREHAPAELRQAMHGRRPGGIREFRLADDRYVHVLAGRSPAGEDYLLVYDVSNQLRVNQALARAWPWLVVMAVALALVAWLLSRWLVSRISRRARGLIEHIGGSPDPGTLKSLAATEEIAEFSQLAHLAAESWGARLQALALERETLAFLGHELRTPLQSARTSLALLKDDPHDQRAWNRLQRAHDRLLRASHSVLWLASDIEPPVDARCAVGPLLAGLAEEFGPLADTRRQTLAVQATPGLEWALPEDIAETVVANGLLNAIQHGGAGTISIDATPDGLQMHNPLPVDAGPAGFGLGLPLAERLLARFGWTLSRTEAEGQVELRLAPRPSRSRRTRR
ncbi:hypothetical protein GCM10011521_14040 [Arenimonas soli]|uniref:histidine kinase n=1 Tax=Arenimonas soli TaxID=2269504 RepID=A0ABQ1HHQ4_9GAMM|nr:HAMP domain-containing sensor histidine kinase [Arenimonas soli]GGA76997.1 hypothetical protein GCM10011521_14040 [Arenimonas soli]